MKKKILVTVIFLITALSMLISGCDKKYGNFYTLEEAYNNGLLTKENLEEIAYYINENLNYPKALNRITEKKIKNDMAYKISCEMNIEKAEARDVFIKAYYGEYSGCYVVRIDYEYWAYPAFPVNKWLEIDGVKIHIIYPELYTVWKNR